MSGIGWMVGVGVAVMLLMAFGIGANDVANTLGTSVGARVLSYRQALVVAAVFEFLGAALLGSRVTDTVRKKIVDQSVYSPEPDLLAAVMLAALVGGAAWLITATVLRLPVSTTHTMIGAVIGASLAAKGTEGVDGKGIGSVVLSWVISPVASGIITAVMYLITRTLILRADPRTAIRRGMVLLPLLYFWTVAVNVFLVLYKGSPRLKLKKLNVGVGIGIACAFGLLAGLLVVWPGLCLVRRYLRWKIDAVTAALGDATSHSTLVSRSRSTAATETQETSTPRTPRDAAPCCGCGNLDELADWAAPDGEIVSPGMANKIADDTIHARRGDSCLWRVIAFWVVPASIGFGTLKRDALDVDLRGASELLGDSTEPVSASSDQMTAHGDSKPLADGKHCCPAVHQCWVRFHDGLDWLQGKETAAAVHANAEVFDFRPETLFSVVQVLTACFGAFAHGSNDVANSVAPFATIFAIHQTGEVAKKAEVDTWILVVGGVGIVVGLFVWGYRVIQTIGRNMCSVTPSRGFAIELGSALSVVVASKLGFPVSTTHAQVGSVVAVGLCEGVSRDATGSIRVGNLNWRLLFGVVLSWIITLPAAGAVAALFAVIFRKIHGV